MRRPLANGVRTGGIRLMSLKVITSLLVLLLVLAACRLTEESKVQLLATPPPRATKVAGTPTAAPSSISTPPRFYVGADFV